MRPQVLRVRAVERRGLVRYDCDGLDDLWREFRNVGRGRVGTAVVFDADATGLVPPAVFRLFDWVICRRLPWELSDMTGAVQTWRHPLPYVRAPGGTLAFIGGFDHARPLDTTAPLDPPPPPRAPQTVHPEETDSMGESGAEEWQEW